MAETCENCGKPMEDWSATHCSEHCLLESVQFSKTLFANSDFDDIINKMRRQNRFDSKLLDDLK